MTKAEFMDKYEHGFLYNPYCELLKQGSFLFKNTVWESQVPIIIRFAKELKLSSVYIASEYSGLIQLLAEFENHDGKVEGLEYFKDGTIAIKITLI